MLDSRIARLWDEDIVPQLIEYIRLPAKSPRDRRRRPAADRLRRQRPAPAYGAQAVAAACAPTVEGEGAARALQELLQRDPGVLGPQSSAHGPNEFIDIPYAVKVCSATARVIAALNSPAATGRRNR